MNKLKINLAKIEEVLKKVGYSDKVIEAFRNKFARVFLQRVGEEIHQDLTQEQKEKLDKLVTNEKTTFKDLADYLKKLGFETKIKQITQKTFEEMIKEILKKMAVLATDEQYKILKQTLFS
jgi:ATP-dependent RNA circularization protein (DNA/RNA ligase family)